MRTGTDLPCSGFDTHLRTDGRILCPSGAMNIYVKVEENGQGHKWICFVLTTIKKIRCLLGWWLCHIRKEEIPFKVLEMPVSFAKIHHEVSSLNRGCEQ